MKYPILTFSSLTSQFHLWGIFRHSLFVLGLITLPLLYANPAETSIRIRNYQASYDLYWNGISVGLSNHTVKEIQKHHFFASVHSFPKLSFLPFESLEQGEFIQTKQDYRPLKSSSKSRANWKRSEGQLLFDWSEQKVIKQWKENADKNLKKEENNIPIDAKDKISFFFQLREFLKAGKKEFHFSIIEHKQVNHWDIFVIGEEILQTPLGKFQTLKLEHRMDNNNRVTQFWVAKELDYILVKLVQYQKGKKRAEVMIKEFK